MTAFEPKIIGFLCNWCCYAGADLAGVSRFQYPPNIRIIRVMCSGRIDPALIVEAFMGGVDGVFVGGCHIGDCHYMTGNVHAEKKIKLLNKMLVSAGFEAKRLRLEWVSAAEGQRFSEVITEFTREIKDLGPNKPTREVVAPLQAAKSALEDFRLRALVSKEHQVVDEGNVYGIKKSPEEFDEVMERAILAEFNRKRILHRTRDKPLSVKDLAEKMNIQTKEVLWHIVSLRRNNFIELTSIEDRTPYYKAVLAGGEDSG